MTTYKNIIVTTTKSKLIADKEQLATAQNAVEVLKSVEEALAEAELLKEF